MCNLCNLTTNQQSTRDFINATDQLGNLEPSIDVYPDRLAPKIRNKAESREMAVVRWGMPGIVPIHIEARRQAAREGQVSQFCRTTEE